MSNRTPVLSVDTLAGHLKSKDTPFEMNELNGGRVIAMGMDFGDAEVRVVLSVAPLGAHSQRLELAGFTTSTYESRGEAALQALNARNHRSGFTRSLDNEGSLWVEYIGFYPLDCPFPESTFNMLMGGFVHHLMDALRALEALPEST